jgi:hypothetical protein
MLHSTVAALQKQTDEKLWLECPHPVATAPGSVTMFSIVCDKLSMTSGFVHE